VTGLVLRYSPTAGQNRRGWDPSSICVPPARQAVLGYSCAGKSRAPNRGGTPGNCGLARPGSRNRTIGRYLTSSRPSAVRPGGLLTPKGGRCETPFRQGGRARAVGTPQKRVCCRVPKRGAGTGGVYIGRGWYGVSPDKKTPATRRGGGRTAPMARLRPGEKAGSRARRSFPRPLPPSPRRSNDEPPPLKNKKRRYPLGLRGGGGNGMSKLPAFAGGGRAEDRT